MLDQTDIQRGRTWYLRRLAPLPFTTIMPDNWTNAASTSPVWAVLTGHGAVIQWRAADATQNFCRVNFRIPAGTSPQTPLLVQGLLMGTATAESIIIKCSKGSIAAGDSVGFDVANSTEQASISIAATWTVVTIAAITPAAAGDLIQIAFRPRTVADANCVQDKILGGLWLLA
jgi:hypothetical protein